MRLYRHVGTEHDNNWGTMSFSPTGAAFVGLLNGLLKITDVTPVSDAR